MIAELGSESMALSWASQIHGIECVIHGHIGDFRCSAHYPIVRTVLAAALCLLRPVIATTYYLEQSSESMPRSRHETCSCAMHKSSR